MGATVKPYGIVVPTGPGIHGPHILTPWTGGAHPPCDLCGVDGARYDGRTAAGPWGYLCRACFRRFGVGVGTGYGQYLSAADYVVGKPDQTARGARIVRRELGEIVADARAVADRLWLSDMVDRFGHGAL